MMHEQLIAELEEFALQMDRRFDNDYQDVKNNGCGNWIFGMRQASFVIREQDTTIADLRAKLAACEEALAFICGKRDMRRCYESVKREDQSPCYVAWEMDMSKVGNEIIDAEGETALEAITNLIAALKEGK